MKITQIVKLQKDGRIALGSAIANVFKLRHSQRMYFYLLEHPQKKGIIISLFELSPTMGCISGIFLDREHALADITGSLSKIGVDFVYSSDRVIIKNENFYWYAIADFKLNNLEQIKNSLKKTGLIQNKISVQFYIEHLTSQFGLNSEDIDVNVKRWNQGDEKYGFQGSPHYRIQLPSELRAEIDINQSEKVYTIILACTECNAIFLSFAPSDTNIAKIVLNIFDAISSLSNVAYHLSDNKIDILESDKRIIRRGEISSWTIIADISRFLKKRGLPEDNFELIKKYLHQDINKSMLVSKIEEITLLGKA